MAETEELAEHDPGEPGGNTDNTEQGVGMLPWWFFLWDLVQLGGVQKKSHPV